MNSVGFSVIRVSQGSVETYVRYDAGVHVYMPLNVAERLSS